MELESIKYLLLKIKKMRIKDSFEQCFPNLADHRITWELLKDTDAWAHPWRFSFNWSGWGPRLVF